MPKKKHGMLVYRENPAEHGPRQSQPSSAEGGELITYVTHLVASSGNTFAVCSCFLWVGFVAKWSVFHELGIGELRQVGHNRLIVHMRVRNFFRRDDLWEDIK